MVLPCIIDRGGCYREEGRSEPDGLSGPVLRSSGTAGAQLVRLDTSMCHRQQKSDGSWLCRGLCGSDAVLLFWQMVVVVVVPRWQ